MEGRGESRMHAYRSASLSTSSREESELMLRTLPLCSL